MYKILSLAAICVIFSSSKAQQAADNKIQAGIMVGCGINFNNPTTKYVSRNGLGNDLSIGMNLNYNYTKTIGFSSGVEFDFQTFNIKTDSNLYYAFNDSEILTKTQINTGNSIFSSTDYKVFKLNERKEKPIYLTVPTMLIFKTQFIGFMRYYGKFGVRNSFLLGNTKFDQGFVDEKNLISETLTKSSNDNMKADKRDLAFYKGAIGLAAGTEWNFSGTTCLAFELGYYYGFLNIYRGKALVGDSEKNMSIISKLDAQDKPTKFNPLALKQNQLMFKIALLF